MRSHFAVVNTFCNDAGELVSERLAPLPYVWDDNEELPPMPTDPLPLCYIPSNAGTPKYLAYVPKLANSGSEKVIPNEKSHICRTCGHTNERVNRVEAKWLKMSREKTF